MNHLLETLETLIPIYVIIKVPHNVNNKVM